MGQVQSKKSRPSSSNGGKSPRNERAKDSQEKVLNGEKGAAEQEQPTLFDNEPIPMAVSLPLPLSQKWVSSILDKPHNQLALSALSTASITDVLFTPTNTLPSLFSNKIPNEGSPVTHQRSSGRCWIFAATNVMRLGLIKKLKLSGFEFSQNYICFWDKYEKANFFLEKIIELTEPGVTGDDADIDGRLWQWLLKAPVNDGGQWDMLVNVVEKYGLVPKAVYPDSFAATATARVNWLITRKLREAALRIHQLRAQEGATGTAGHRSPALVAYKLSVLKSIHNTLVLTFGPPPGRKENFTWEYVDTTGEYHRLVDTPLHFYQAVVGYQSKEYFSLVNDPRNPYQTILKVQHLGNVAIEKGVRPVKYLNVSADTLRKAAADMIKAGHAVFFGCDVGKFAEITGAGKDGGWLDCHQGHKGLFNYPLILGDNAGTGSTFTKAERLRMGESLMTHAMVFTAVHIVDGKPVRWRVENSWGPESGEKGYLVMSDEWFGEYVYQVVTTEEYVDKETGSLATRAAMYGNAAVNGSSTSLSSKDVIELPVWDPMGSLA